MDEWYRITLHRLIEVCRLVTSKYTRSKVRKALPKDYAYIIDELLHTNYDETDKRDYYENIISTIIDLDRADGFIEAVSAVIKRMAVDHMHIVGDIFDRGPRADIIMDSLMDYHSVDIQWGNHDVLWMGAASGSRTLVATVLANSIHYNNLEVIETGYGISLRPLAVFANEVYRDCDVHRFAVKLTGPDADQYSEKDKLLSARMHKAITVILFKLEGQKHAAPPGVRHGGPAAAGQDRLRESVHHHRRGHLSPGGHRLPHRGPQGPLHPHPGGEQRHRPAHRLLPAQREAPAARPLPVLQGRASTRCSTAICSSTAASP